MVCVYVCVHVSLCCYAVNSVRSANNPSPLRPPDTPESRDEFPTTTDHLSYPSRHKDPSLASSHSLSSQIHSLLSPRHPLPPVTSIRSTASALGLSSRIHALLGSPRSHATLPPITSVRRANIELGAVPKHAPFAIEDDTLSRIGMKERARQSKRQIDRKMERERAIERERRQRE